MRYVAAVVLLLFGLFMAACTIGAVVGACVIAAREFLAFLRNR